MTTNTPFRPALFPSTLGATTNTTLRRDLEYFLNTNREISGVPLLVSLNKQATSQGEGFETVLQLGRENALKLTVFHEGGLPVLRKIDLHVKKLLNGACEETPTEKNLEAAHSLAMDLISPLLMQQSDLSKILPGFGATGTPAKISCWNSMQFRFSIPSVPPLCIHNLSHPAATRGDALVQDESIQVGQLGDDWLLRIENPYGTPPWSNKWKASFHPLRVSLTLRDQCLVSFLKNAGYSEFCGVVGAGRIDFTHAIQKEMFKLKGVYIPIPLGDPSEDGVLKLARVIALGDKVNPSSRRALMETVKAVFARSSGKVWDNTDGGFAALKSSVRAEKARIEIIKASSLFAEVSTACEDLPWPAIDWPIHPLDAAVCGCDTEVTAG